MVTDMPDINYKELLKKYMEHINYCEGTMFLYAITSISKFSIEEVNELNKIADSI